MNHFSFSSPGSTRFVSLVALMTLLRTSPLLAEVRLPHVLSDHMVLQRDVSVRIWGWAEPDENVTVTLDKQRATAVASKDHRWEVHLSAMKAVRAAQVIDAPSIEIIDGSGVS